MIRLLPTNYDKLDWVDRRSVREQYIDLQDNKCMHCKYSLDEDPPRSVTDQNITWSLFPPNFLKHPVHLQHNHDTGMTEGAIHAYCNAVLWEHHGR